MKCSYEPLKFCMFYFVFLYLILFGNSAFANKSLIMLEKEDISSITDPKKPTNKELRHPPTPEPFPPSNVVQRIIDTYTFLGEFEEEDHPAIPKNWTSKFEDPAKSLILGSPRFFTRPNFEIKLPLYLLSSLPMLNGESELISTLNTALQYWQIKDYQKTFFLLLEIEEKIKKLPLADYTGLSAKILISFFHLQMSAEENETLVPDSEVRTAPIKADQHYAKARIILRSALMQLNDFDFFRENNFNVEQSIFQEQFSLPVYFNDLLPISKLKNTPKFYKKSLDPSLWIRTVAMQAWWNVTILQRVRGLYAESFSASETMEKISKKLPSALDKLKINGPTLRKQTNPLTLTPAFLWPQRNADLHATMYLLNALNYFEASDPLEALKNADRSIRTAESKDISAIAMHIAGMVYYDLSNFRLARRAFAWSEAISKNFAENYPIVYLLGGESAFWLGKWKKAKESLEEFLVFTGDKEFGPFARLRLAEIENIMGNNENSVAKYEELIRNYSKHDVYKDAIVRYFCGEQFHHSISIKQKAAIYKKMFLALNNSRDELKEEAKTCALLSDLEVAAAKTSTIRSKILEDSLIQENLIKAWEKDYPDSQYNKLLVDIKKKLSLTPIIKAIEDNKCSFVQNFYKEKREELNTLQDKGSKFLKTLVWKNSDRMYVLRCTALYKNTSLWAELLKTDYMENNKKIIKITYNHTINPTPKNAIEIANYLDSSKTNDWSVLLQDFSNTGDLSIKKDNFWDLISIRELIAYNLQFPEQSKFKFKQSLLKNLFNNPKIITKNEELCLWSLSESKSFNSREWDKIFSINSSEYWINQLLNPGSIDSQANSKNPLANTPESSKIGTDVPPTFTPEPGITPSTLPVVAAASSLITPTVTPPNNLSGNVNVSALPTISPTPSVSFIEKLKNIVRPTPVPTISAEETERKKIESEQKHPYKKAGICMLSFANEMLTNSFNLPSKKRDKELLLPYLEKIGMKNGSEYWLSYIQRLEKEKGTTNKEVQKLYKTLYKETENAEIKDSTKLWLENNLIPSDVIW